ncbi:MAG: patatin-like phospholipase family protein [Sphaerochaetaceae bacterium]|jgi:predicted acylesterase/phospholipase RssA
MLVVMSIWGTRKKQQIADERDDRYILCIDGGGMRGVVPAVLLGKLARLLQDAGDERPFYAHFDLIAGTSTGGLLALALAAPADKSGLSKEGAAATPVFQKAEPSPAWKRVLFGDPPPVVAGVIPDGIDPDQLLNLYLESGKDIFPKGPSRPLSILGPIFSDKYDEKPLMRLLRRVFDDIPLSDATIPVMVVTYDTKHASPILLSSRDSHGFLMREAARATSAAPTFFSPAIIKDRQTGKILNLIDGGVVANNPVLYAYHEAKHLYPDAKRFHILSFSTASSTFSFDAGKAGGVIGWVDPAKGAPIQKIYAQSQMQTSDMIAASITDLDYIRIHGELGAEHVRLDDTSEVAMDKLSHGAERIFQENYEALQGFAIQLSKRTNFDQVRLPPDTEPSTTGLDGSVLPRIDAQKQLEDSNKKSIPDSEYNFEYNLETSVTPPPQLPSSTNRQLEKTTKIGSRRRKHG